MPYNDKQEWTPKSPKQSDFLRLPITIKEALFGGGAGSGKSELLCMYPVVHGWHNQQGFKQLFLRRTYPELKREIIPRTQILYPPLGGKFNKADLVWTFPREDQYGSGYSNDGGMIFFGHCENEDDVHNYDGMEINLFTPDELTSFTEYIYTYIGFTRVRTSYRNLPAIIRASGMPGDVGHAFVKKRFIDPAPEGGVVIEGRGGNLRIYIHSTYLDNPAGDPNYGQSLEAIPDEAERKAKKYGDWSSYEGVVFDEFRDKRYPHEPDNAVHVIDPFAIPSHWPRICAIDWGYSAMCSVGWAAISPEPRIYVYRHQAFYREKIAEWTAKVKTFIDIDNPSDVVICHSANQHRGEAHSIFEQVTEALNVPLRLGEQDRIGGKNLIHDYLRWKKPELNFIAQGEYNEEMAQWLLRNRGLDAYKDYINTFNPVMFDEVLPRMRFFNDPQVKLIWEALKACSYQKSVNGKKKEDVAEFDGDDPYDMLRMLVHAADRFFQTSKDKQAQIEKFENVINRFQATGDTTQFYRNMRRVENEVNSSYQPIRRYHRGR